MADRMERADVGRFFRTVLLRERPFAVINPVFLRRRAARNGVSKKKESVWVLTSVLLGVGSERNGA